MNKPLFKTTIVIWTEWDPRYYEIDYMACEAIGGGAYCSSQTIDLIQDPQSDPTWDGTEFFEDGADND